MLPNGREVIQLLLNLKSAIMFSPFIQFLQTFVHANVLSYRHPSFAYTWKEIQPLIIQHC